MRKATQRGFARLLAMLIVGLFTLAGCGSDGSDGKDGADGAPGAPGEPGQAWQETAGAVNVSFTVSGATGGSGEFREGDRMTVVVQAKDAYGYDMDPADLNQLALRINGPRSNVNATTVPTKLFGGSVNANGSVTANNVNLRTAATYDAAAKTWTYTTEPISDEGAGTYTVAVQAQGPLDQDGVRRAQDFELQDVQIKTALVDDLTIERFKCAACHLGANNGKFYLHHIDGGDWARDSNPVKNCKNCHNNSAVAGYNVCALAGTEGDLMLRDTDISARQRPGGCPTGYVQARRADNIVNRVHGIHMGQDRRGTQLNTDGTPPASHPAAWKPRNTANKRGLQNPRNIAYPGSPLFDSTGTDKDGNVHAVGDFRNFAAVGFPSDVRNCEKCHADTAWKEKPSRLACGTCHDNVNFSFGGARSAFEPRYGKCDDGGAFATDANGRPQCVNAGATYVGEIAHPGGRQTDDTQCTYCHLDGGMAPIAEVHAKPVPTSGAPRVNNKAGKFTVETTWSGKAGAYYVAGEAPVLTVVIKENGNPIDHTTVVQGAWTVNAWLQGPRAKKMPVLSSAARADITSKPGPFDFGGGGPLQIELDGGAGDAAGVGSTNGVTASVDLAAGAMTAAEVAAALNADPVFASKGVAYTLDADTGNAADVDYLKIRTKPNHGYSGIRVLNTGVAGVLFDNGSDADLFNDIGKQYDLFTGSATSADPTTRSASGSYSEFQLHLRTATNGSADPKLTLTPEGLVYRFDTIDDSIPAGTYTLALTVADADSMGAGTTPITYYTELVQIGTGTEEKLIASNCKSCHDYDKRWHENAPRGDGYPFSTNYCGSCHDYKQQRGGVNVTNGLPYSWLAQAGVSTGSNWGFGAQPHSKRLHGLHFGNYLQKPAEVHTGYQIGKVIYPVDARNCEKCHATAASAFSTANQYNVMGVQKGVRDANATVLATWANGPFQAGKGGTAAEVEAGTADFEITSGSNVSNPTRIACNGCHDTDAAIAHTTLMTFDPTPANPFSGDEKESCATCHGANRDFAVSTGIMNVNTPFLFPYARRPSWLQ